MKASPLAALALAACVGGCSRSAADYRQSWQRVELPGFSVELPDGPVGTSSTSPSNGQLQRKLPRSWRETWDESVMPQGTVVVSWSTESRSYDEWHQVDLPMSVATLSAMIPGAQVMSMERVADDRWMVSVGTVDAPLAIGVVRCDPAFQVALSYARYSDALRQAEDLREILRSVRCDVRAENRAVLRVATRLPAKLGLVSAGDPQVFRSLDGEELSVMLAAGDIRAHRDAYEAMISHMLRQQLGSGDGSPEWVPIDAAGVALDRTKSLFLVHLSDVERPMYVGAQYCGRDNMTVLSMWSAPKRADAVAIERLAQVGCAGMESTESPSFDSLVETACAGGDRAACALRAAPTT